MNRAPSRHPEAIRATARRRAAGIPVRGRSPRRKLTDEMVREIRAVDDRSWRRLTGFARRFGVAPAVILQVIEGWTYREVQ
jgi:hypothetical protein